MVHALAEVSASTGCATLLRQEWAFRPPGIDTLMLSILCSDAS